MSSKINIQNSQCIDKVEFKYPAKFSKDLAKVVCLQLPDAELFAQNCLNSNKIEYKLTDVLLKLNEVAEKIAVSDSCQKGDTLFSLAQNLESEIQNIADVNSNWFELKKYFHKICFFTVKEEETKMDVSGINCEQLDLVERLKEENLKLKLKLIDSEKEKNHVASQLERQVDVNAKIDKELDEQLARNIKISLEFKKQIIKIENELRDLNDEYVKLNLKHEDFVKKSRSSESGLSETEN